MGIASAVLVLVVVPEVEDVFSLVTVIVCSCRQSHCRGVVGEGSFMLEREMWSSLKQVWVQRDEQPCLVAEAFLMVKESLKQPQHLPGKG